MADKADRTSEQRRREIHDEVRRRQTLNGHSSPIPSFFNVVTDILIDVEALVQTVDARLDVIANDVQRIDEAQKKAAQKRYKDGR